MSSPIPIRLCLIMVSLTCAAVGCSLWNQETTTEKPKTQMQALALAQDAVELEVRFVERPLGDFVLEKGIWRELDQIGALDPSVRETLHANGLRVGVAGSTPPRALQGVLDENIQRASLDPLSGEDLNGRRVLVRSTGETEIQALPIVPSLTIAIPESNGTFTERTFENARCVLKVKAAKLQDGWVNLEFLPEIHYGENQLRRVALQGGWQLKTEQDKLPLYQQKFEIKLNLGEMALLTMTPQEETGPTRTGRVFFVGADPQARVQRLLIVRLSGLGHAQDVTSERQMLLN